VNEIQLVAGRFAMLPDSATIDLATGDQVTLSMGTAGGPSDQIAWASRCDALHRLLRRTHARLIDYGAVGDGQRFEAWSRVTGGGLRDRTDEPALDLTLIDRRGVAALAELFDATADCRPRAVSLFGPPGAGKTTAIGELARAARLNGFVPVSAALLTFPLTEALAGRTLFVIDDDSQGSGWAALMTWTMRSPRPHVVLFTGVEEMPSAQGVALERLPVEALIHAVTPTALTPALAERVRRAAEHAGGWPGRFAAELWGRRADAQHAPRRRMVPGSLRAAEQPGTYGAEPDPPIALPADAHALRTWPAPGELAGLRRRMDAAMRQLDRGRHAPGDRALRQAIGGLSRRADWGAAGQGAIALAASLLKRGRARDAQSTLDEARDYCTRARQAEALVDVATLAGHAWIDTGRLDEAEAVLAAAIAAATAAGHIVRRAEASLAMARCLFWRGRYADADATLLALDTLHLSDAVKTRVAVMRSRIAVGLRDYARALSCAADARQRAAGAQDPDLMSAAASAAAFAHLAVNDLEAVEREAAKSIALARTARSPLRAIRARLLLAEVERRRDRRVTATAVLQRLTRLSGSLPPIVRARLAYLTDLLKTDAAIQEVTMRHTRTTGLAALALLTPDAPGSHAGIDVLVPDLIDILHVCQNAEEDTAVLAGVCARVRHQLHAAAVAFVVADGNAARTGSTSAAGYVAIAADGGRLEMGIAERALTAGIAIAPHCTDDRIEAAAPVRYGGTAVAALVARWSIGTPHELSRVSTVLTMAATAAAPAVAGAIARRARPACGGPTELLGISESTAELRRAVERAAAAPFSVLIEGESGSGKELVARAVHRLGPRRDRAFCTLNCAALPDDLVESELFGHARGAFTGAISERPGVFEEAHGGTLFLDEIGELSLRAQAKVLRVIQEGELRRVGENMPRRVDVRIVAATNRDLRDEVVAGRFRLDLRYRLDVVRIVVAPLRERSDDIAVLVEHFWRDTTRRVGSRATLAAATIAALARYDWPGNVRELQNVLAALAVRTPKRGVVPPSALPPQFGNHRSGDTWRLNEARNMFEAQFVRAALVRSGGHRAQAAAELGVTRQGLAKLMTRLSISDPGLTTS
jgi:DNA-binding NtrC family response regulator/tetratricopeptide (TPR) repeat protein